MALRKVFKNGKPYRYGYLVDRVQVDPEDSWLLDAYNWSINAHTDRLFYVKSSYGLKLHRLIANAPPGMVVDHINGDTLDNRRENLRVCTNAENVKGQHRARGASQYKGVYWNKHSQKWAVQIGGVVLREHLGRYVDEKDAARAYNEAALRIYGEFAVLNEVD